MDDTSAVVRPAVRVLLLDDLDRALLFRGVGDDGSGFWFPPGGGLEPDETHEAAALRELTEETGWREPVLGPYVGERRHVVAWGGVTYDCRERWFLARVAGLSVSTVGFTQDERETISAHRWWSLDELGEADEPLVPSNLPQVVAGIVRHGAPSTPLQLPV